MITSNMDPFRDLLTKHSGIYRTPDDIKNLKIKITFCEITEHPKILEKEFSWQQKWFSKRQKEFYREEENCITDLDKRYFNMLNEMDDDDDDDVLFSYINEDSFVPESKTNLRKHYLQTRLENFTEINDELNENEYDFRTDLYGAIRQPIIKGDIEQMFILADLGEYSEKLLCSIKYNKQTKSLTVDPDFTTTQPYTCTLTKEEKLFWYFIENRSPDIPEAVRLKEEAIISKIQSLKSALLRPELRNTFQLPPKNKLFAYLFFEVMSGRGFEYPDLYVEYFIDLRGEWNCQNLQDLRGRTQICKARAKDGVVHFGHCFELVLDCNIENLNKTDVLKTPYIYFEIVSKDSWERHRTEGLCYRSVPVTSSGVFAYNLHCFRFLSKSLGGKLRRSFIGDYRNYDDLTWIGIPQHHENKVLNKFGTSTLSTGEINIKVNVVHQSQAFLEEFNPESKTHRNRQIYDKLKCSGLIKSVEEVLRAFKKARRRMLEVKANV